MIALIQRVLEAHVDIAAESGVGRQTVGRIGPGLLALIGVEKGDGPRNMERLAERLLGYRVFPDDSGRMNLGLRDTAGGLLLVPQFTLAADTRSGTRPSFSTAAPPEEARALFDALVARLRGLHPVVETGRFGAEMFVGLLNHGPVTFRLDA